MKNNLTKRTNIRLLPEEKDGLDRFAEDNFLDISKAVRKIVVEYLRANNYIAKPEKQKA